jgi:hypothetical protein
VKPSDVQELCLGSGTYFEWTTKGESRRCPVCGRMVRLTTGGRLRPHKPKLAVGEA